MTPIELLAPAKNAGYGIQAINHGADAVYIGAPSFGARAAVSNSVAEIEMLIRHAHLYRAKVYITLNTILFDDEMAEAGKLIQQLYNIGVDGIIVQDMGILELQLPPVKLIASTQTHNASPEKVKFLEDVGFKRVILARELSLIEIREIRKNSNVELESFIHGALCVSYSGQCYMSQAVCGRSGNRGICAQPCRSSYDLVDKNDEVIVPGKHLLSLKDLNLTTNLKDLMEAGITSFKIEGRLKDLSYLKNVVSHYRQEIDTMLSTTNGYAKSSSGSIQFDFKPDPEKSFNRGFTPYFIEGRKGKTGSYLTQKSLGKRIGRITRMEANWFKLDGEELHNGDGICFFDNNQALRGTSINKIDGNKIYPKDLNGLKVGQELYRNHDQQFEKLVEKEVSKRNISVSLRLTEWENGFCLSCTDEDGYSVEYRAESQKIIAEKPDVAKNQITNQLSKFGNTPFIASSIDIETDLVYFIPVSLLNQMRREICSLLENRRISEYQREEFIFQPNTVPFPGKQLSYQGNVLNGMAAAFYKRHGVETIEPALETLTSYENKTLMTTKHCIRYQLDACPVHQQSVKRFNEPLYLKDNNHTYRLLFDCKACVMNVILEK
jgi:Collagenase and related proteases